MLPNTRHLSLNDISFLVFISVTCVLIFAFIFPQNTAILFKVNTFCTLLGLGIKGSRLLDIWRLADYENHIERKQHLSNQVVMMMVTMMMRMKLICQNDKIAYLLIPALKLWSEVAGSEDTETFVTAVTAVRAVVTHQRVRHVLHAVVTREGGRKWR